jgi:hypothetical protein
MLSTTPSLGELTSSATPSEATIETYALHKLCEACKGFFEEWQILDRFVSSEDQPSPEKTTFSFLRTVAQIAESAVYCHFCKSIFASLEEQRSLKVPDVMDKNVWLRCTPRGEDPLNVSALYSAEQPKNEEMGTGLASFALESYHGKSRIAKL